jgi:hypothetical protein
MTKAQILDEGLIPDEVLATKILKKLAALSHHYQKPAPGVEVFLVNFHVLGELTDASGENRYLHLRRAGVCAVRLVFLDDLLFQFFVYQFLHS